MSPSDWSALRTQYTTLLYPHGLPINGVDVQLPMYTGIPLPGGAVSMTRYQISDPGQRPGGDPQFTYLVYPQPETAKNELIVWMCGNLGWIDYAGEFEGFVIDRMVETGYHVLVCDMPSFNYTRNPIGTNIIKGGTWSYSGSWSNVGGTLTNYPPEAAHSYDFDSDGGPLGLLQYIHHALVSTTSAIETLTPSQVFLAGHSGGLVAAYLGAIDSRYKGLYLNCPGLPYNETWSIASYMAYELCWNNYPWVRSNGIFDTWAAMRLAASWPGRHTDLVSSVLDEWWPINASRVGTWTEDNEALFEFANRAGSNFTYWLDPTDNGVQTPHSMNSVRISRMISLMASD